MKTPVKQINKSRCSTRCIKASNIKEGMYVLPLQNKTTAKTIVACDHEFLHSECSYFEKEYIKRRKKKGS